MCSSFQKTDQPQPEFFRHCLILIYLRYLLKSSLGLLSNDPKLGSHMEIWKSNMLQQSNNILPIKSLTLVGSVKHHLFALVSVCCWVKGSYSNSVLQNALHALKPNQKRVFSTGLYWYARENTARILLKKITGGGTPLRVAQVSEKATKTPPESP